MKNSHLLYSHNGQEPQPLPDRIRLKNGLTSTDLSSFTNEELADAGFTGPYEIPEYNQENQKLFWDSENLSYVLEDISEKELWDKIRAERNHLLSLSDWTMTVDAPQVLNFREWEMYRQRLRDIPSLYENPKDVVWPSAPTENDIFEHPRSYEDAMIWRVRNLEGFVKKIYDKLFPSVNLSEIVKKVSLEILPDVDVTEEQQYILDKIIQKLSLHLSTQLSVESNVEEVLKRMQDEVPLETLLELKIEDIIRLSIEESFIESEKISSTEEEL
jgi:hypothetical protein